MSNNMNRLTAYQAKLQSTRMFLIGTHTVTPSDSASFGTLVSGLVLFKGILLDSILNLPNISSEVAASTIGRIFADRGDVQTLDLNPLFVYLDSLDTSMMDELKAGGVFKGHLRGLPQITDGLALPVHHVVSLVIKTLRKGDLGDREAVMALRQIAHFLRKIEVARPDLEEAAHIEFATFESRLAEAESGRRSHAFDENLRCLNALAIKHLANFSVEYLTPRHGPGAVADPKVKDWYTKNLSFASDARINYMLGRSSLGTMNDYCYSLGTRKSTRTSRFTCVPKTWKKLRGISAEPVELQYFQQAINQRIDDMFRHDMWWGHRVDLHDQSSSRRLAQRASRTGEFVTVDLSAASDSVTTTIVKEVFKNTPLILWLLATRSTHSDYSGGTVKLTKFAPMGSACCFPVQCIVFTLAAQLAVDRTYIACLDNDPVVRVFGDDIILNTYAYEELITILTSLGFSINIDKSFASGYFREACGCDAYRGLDVTPLRHKAIRLPHARVPLPLEVADAIAAFSNGCFDRGLWVTRSYALRCMLNACTELKGSRPLYKTTLAFSFSGESGSIKTCNPTLYLVKSRYNRRLWRSEYSVIGGKVRAIRDHSVGPFGPTYDGMKYLECLINHQARDPDREENLISSIGSTSINVSRIPVGHVRVPFQKWKGEA